MAAARRRRRATRNSPPPPWVWSVGGLVVGLLVAFLVFLQMRPKQAPETPLTLEVPAEHETPAVRKPKDKPVPKPPPKPRFDFYNLLPEMEVVVSDEDIQGQATQEGVKQVEQPGTYLLQAGSFRSRKQADQLRAKLGLLGLETSIQTVSVDSAQTWHRVRVGPFSNLRELNDARALLKKNGVDAILIRLKG
ncbi:MAG: SPOR domain-containing protein [Thiogranum sp.]|jgi:cell division protein FtsN